MTTMDCDAGYCLDLAERYYRHLLGKDFEAMGACVHPEVQLISPLAAISGKDAVVEAAKNLSQILSHIEFRAKFAEANRIMFAYDFFFPDPIGTLRSAVLMEFKDHLISRIELFYDARPFDTQKETIFSDGQG